MITILSNLVPGKYYGIPISFLNFSLLNSVNIIKLTEISKKVLNTETEIDIAINKINTIVYRNLKLDGSIIEKIEDFALNLSKRV